MTSLRQKKATAVRAARKSLMKMLKIIHKNNGCVSSNDVEAVFSIMAKMYCDEFVDAQDSISASDKPKAKKAMLRSIIASFATCGISFEDMRDCVDDIEQSYEILQEKIKS